MAASAQRVVWELFFHRVHFTAGRRELREYFNQFGRVLRCDLVLNKETGFSKGYGWVAFANENAFQSVLQKDEHLVDGYKIEVRQQARKGPKNTEQQNEV